MHRSPRPTLLTGLALLAGSPSVVAQAAGPGARSCASATWSAAQQTVVLLGGSSTACGVEPILDGALWGWNGTRWSRIALTGGPGPREDALLTPGTNSLLLVGGRRLGTVYQDVWRFADGRWSVVHTVGASPGRLEHTAGAFDGRRHELVLFGGALQGAPGRLSRQTALLRDTTWSLHTDAFGPAARIGHGMTWSPDHDGVLLYGGFAAAGSFRDLWHWNGLRWRLVDSVGPTHIEGPALITTDSGVVVLGAGLNAQPGEQLRAWRWHNNAWHALPGMGPPLRIGQVSTWDPIRRSIVVLGGNLPNQPASNQVWEYHLGAWTRKQ